MRPRGGCSISTRALDRPVDVVIATKFPTYFVRHPAKVAWLVHQHRAAYELCGTPYSDFDHTERDVGLRKRLIDLDTRMLAECRGLFSIARTVSARAAEVQPAHGRRRSIIRRGWRRRSAPAPTATTC